MDSAFIKSCICTQLKETKREGIEDLIDYMDENGFFESPASGGNHMCKEGGLAEHSMNVNTVAKQIAAVLLTDEELESLKDSITIVTLLHDLGKIGAFGKALYVPNMVKDGRVTKANPVQKYKQSESKPYERNKDLTNVPHAFRSVILATRYIDLTEDEEFAIMYHDGLYDRETGGYAIIPGHETKLLMILHWADMWSSKIIEKKEEK